MIDALLVLLGLVGLILVVGALGRWGGAWFEFHRPDRSPGEGERPPPGGPSEN